MNATEALPRLEPSALLLANPLIAVLRARDASDYHAAVEVLAESGVRSIELTLTTPGTFEQLPGLVTRMGSGVEIGVGTVTTADEARRAIDGGAKYLVTPIVNLEVIAVALKASVPVIPGGLTPTELHAAWIAGATAVKIFPAETVGPQYGSHLRGPFPSLRFIPSGGVRLEDIPAWLKAGATAVSLGGPLIGDAMTGGSLTALGERARRAATLAAEASR